MRTILGLLAIIGITALLVAACGPAPTPPAAPPGQPPAGTTAAAPKPSRDNWDNIVAEAQKEGAVSVYTIWPPQARQDLSNAFSARFNIKVENTLFSRGPEMLTRVQAEKTAGLNVADVYGGGSGTLITNMKPVGVLGTIEPFVFRQDVLDAKFWRGGKLPFIDKDKTAIALIEGAQHGMVINTDMVKRGEITSYKDLLKPQYKGKITINDPSVTGQGNFTFALLAYRIWNLDQTKDYFTQLIKQQGAVVQRDNRLHGESIARGKFAIGLGAASDIVIEFVKAGAPLEMAVEKEGVGTSAGFGGVGVPLQVVHPNATKVFINWLLTGEGQTVLTQSFGYPSRRTDVSTEGINPIMLPQQGQEVFAEDEDFINFKGQTLAMSRKIIEDAAK